MEVIEKAVKATGATLIWCSPADTLHGDMRNKDSYCVVRCEEGLAMQLAIHETTAFTIYNVTGNVVTRDRKNKRDISIKPNLRYYSGKMEIRALRNVTQNLVDLTLALSVTTSIDEVADIDDTTYFGINGLTIEIIKY